MSVDTMVAAIDWLKGLPGARDGNQDTRGR